MSSQFQGKIAIVTGATSGLGKAVAFGLAKAGATVVVAGRRAEEGGAVVEEITATGGKATFFKADISQEDQIEALVKFTVEKYGRLDLAFNNAGIISQSPITEVTKEEYDSVFNTNVWGVLASMKHELRAMEKTGGGAIVNNSSIVGMKGFPNMSVYVASKHAVEGLTKSVAKEYAQKGVRVNSVAPGPFLTEGFEKGVPTDAQQGFAAMIPQGRLANPKELVPVVLNLLDPNNTFVTGMSYVVDGGFLA